MLVTTHLIAEWNNVADRCLLCRDGVIEQELDPSDLLLGFPETEPAAVEHNEDETRIVSAV